MTANGLISSAVSQIEREEATWDAAVLANGGHLLQSWRWGEFKAKFGWRVERLAVPSDRGVVLGQVLFRQRAGMSIGYLPRGPVVTPGDEAGAEALWAAIGKAARRRRALTIIVEPDHALSDDTVNRLDLVPGPAPIQPARTVKVALLDDESLMAQMHAKTRYNVRMAQRRGVEVVNAPRTAAASHVFFDLLQDTAARNAFEIHAADYYRDFLDLFSDDAVLMFAEVEGRPVSGAIAVCFGSEAIYMYGASSTKERAHGAAFLIQYEIMRWARDRGCQRYDLWGIPAHDPTSSRAESGDRLASSSGGDRRGLYEFKTRFGGQIVSYPPPLERRYRPLLAALARRFYGAGADA